MTNRVFRSLLFLAALALPISASRAQDADDASEAEPPLPLAAEFEPYTDLPQAPEPGAEVVDLESFDPPLEPETTSLGSGIASYYGKRFHGRRTASGERFDMHALTAAHKTLPFGSMVRVTNPRNGKSVVVRINDRGPFSPGRTIDLSRAAAEEIGLVRHGHGTVELELLK